jgi:hypothetical protein
VIKSIDAITGTLKEARIFPRIKYAYGKSPNVSRDTYYLLYTQWADIFDVNKQKLCAEFARAVLIMEQDKNTVECQVANSDAMRAVR